MVILIIIISLLQFAMVVVEDKSTGIKILVDFGHQLQIFISSTLCAVW